MSTSFSALLMLVLLLASCQANSPISETSPPQPMTETAVANNQPVTLEAIPADQVIQLIDSSAADQDHRVVPSLIAKGEDLVVYYADQDRVVYGLSGLNQNLSFIQAIYDYDFATGTDRTVYEFAPSEMYDMGSVTKYGDDYFVTWYDPRRDDTGYFDFYVSRLTPGKIEHLFQVKANSVWQIPFNLTITGQTGSSLFQTDADSKVQRLVVDFATGTCQVEPVDWLNISGVFHKNNYSGNSQAEVFTSTSGNQTSVHYRVADKVYQFDKVNRFIYGVLGNQLLVADNSRQRIDVYDENLAPVGSIPVSKRVHMLSAINDQLTFYQMDSDNSRMGYLVLSDDGIAMVPMPVPIYTFPRLNTQGFALGYSADALPYQIDKQAADGHQMIHVHTVWMK